MKIPITKTVLGEEEKFAIQKPLESGWLVQGPNVAEFESQFRSYINSQYAKAVTSCTTALHLALDALGVGPGDKVIVPSFTYVASANAVTYTGADVIFCDIDLDTFNIDISALSDILSKNDQVKAVMPVHLFGLCANMEEILRLANEHELLVIEDAACALGSYISNKHAGTFGDAGCFSFHPRKAITTGEGGMVVTDDESLFQVMKQLCDHGASKSDLERHLTQGGSLLPDFSLRGFNYRMTDIQGALGVVQMKKAKEIIAKRCEVAKLYDEALATVDYLVRPSVPQSYTHSFQSYVCLFTDGIDFPKTIDGIDALNIKRNQLMGLLEERGVATRQGTHAVHTLSYYKKRYGLQNSDFLNSYTADRLSISLPLYASMTADEFDYVIASINECYQCVE